MSYLKVKVKHEANIGCQLFLWPGYRQFNVVYLRYINTSIHQA